LPDLEDQTREFHPHFSPSKPSARHLTSGAHASVVPVGGRPLPQFKDQVHGNIHGVLASERVPAAGAPIDFMPRYKDQVQDVHPRSSPVTDHASHRADSSPRRSSAANTGSDNPPTYKDQIRTNIHLQSSCPVMPLIPDFKSQCRVFHPSDQSRDPPPPQYQSLQLNLHRVLSMNTNIFPHSNSK
jgi:hypothetical protein